MRRNVVGVLNKKEPCSKLPEQLSLSSMSINVSPSATPHVPAHIRNGLTEINVDLRVVSYKYKIVQPHRRVNTRGVAKVFRITGGASHRETLKRHPSVRAIVRKLQR